MNNNQQDNAEYFSDFDSLPAFWENHYRAKLTSPQEPLQELMMDIIHEFMVPLMAIRGYAELIRDYAPASEPLFWPDGTVLTSKDLADTILKFVKRQQLMFDFVRHGAWENSLPTENDSE